MSEEKVSIFSRPLDELKDMPGCEVFAVAPRNTRRQGSAPTGVQLPRQVWPQLRQTARPIEGEKQG